MATTPLREGVGLRATLRAWRWLSSHSENHFESNPQGSRCGTRAFGLPQNKGHHQAIGVAALPPPATRGSRAPPSDPWGSFRVTPKPQRWPCTTPRSVAFRPPPTLWVAASHPRGGAGHLQGWLADHFPNTHFILFLKINK